MNTIIAIGLCLAGSCIIIGLLDRWCRPVKFTQLTRFKGNDVALESYESRLTAAGIGKVRNVRDAK